VGHCSGDSDTDGGGTVGFAAGAGYAPLPDDALAADVARELAAEAAAGMPME
jgi:hypothetical protein